MKDWMPKGGVKELQSSSSGRKYLGKLQAKYKEDLLQPGDSGFQKRYGSKLEVQRKEREAHEKKAKDEWGDKRERREFKNKRYVGNN